ncbi:MAG: Tfp pilus assembly protein tip-associated adhesin PilY1-like protein [Moraxellaceae bacterium]|jgi:type IV pilus assembly protein PilY1|nr:Tfp pilus assembly protein tip-associated adhesin PilY1-like protein [Moraxellaceae bacterium]
MDAVKGVFARRRLFAGLLAFLLGCLSLAPVYASDTEVYVRPVDFSGDVTPVLMMVLDSSGSMRDCLENCNAGNPARLTRIGALRQSMRKVLFGDPEPVTGGVVKPAPDFIKMGYARFNPDANDGGWMRYPALKLSKTVPDAWTISSSLENRIGASGKDAFGNNLGANDVSGSALGGGSYTVGASMSALGLRFEDLQIPRNATITGAMLHFTRAGTSGSVPNSLKVAAESAGNSAVFTTDGTDGRTWSADTSPSTDDGVTTFYVNVGSLVQGVVNRADWCGGNALSLRVTSNGGSRTASVHSFEGNEGAAPVLIVSYTTAAARTGSCISAPVDVVLGVRSSYDDIEWPEGGSGIDVSYRQPTMSPAAVPDSVRNLVALRFPEVPVIPNATIQKAWLYLTSAKSDTVPAPIEVGAFATDNLAEFCTQNATTRKVSCTPPPAGALTPMTTLTLPGSAADVSTDGVHRALDVTAQVAAVTGRPGWASNNSLGFLLRNSGSTNVSSSIYAMDSTLSRSAFLHIIYRKQFSNLDEIDKTARQDLYDDISARMYASGGTPLGDAYAEAARYLLGMAAYSKDIFTTTFDDQIPSQTYSQPDSRTVAAGKYVSPLENTSECSANYIYLMSDGEPNNASNVNNNSNGITGGYNQPCTSYSKIPTSSGNTNTNFSCMMSVAQHLSSGVNQRKAVIRTNTVLFDDTLTGSVVTDMETVADDYGKGQFFHAKTSAQLTDSLLSTMTSMINQAGSITAPGVAVNQFNRLTHLDQLYYAMFDPDGLTARWRGNVKRYRLMFQDTPMADGSIKQTTTIVGQDGKPAIDPATTFFSTAAHSFWSTSADGNKAVEGGVASMLPLPAERLIYTYLPAYGTEMTLSTLDEVDVAAARSLMGLTTDGQVENVFNWLKGYGSIIVKDKDPNVAGSVPTIKVDAEAVSDTTKVRNELGGVLHSQPVLVNYGYTSKTPEAAQLDASLQDNMLFFSTMEGMLHAVDANTGVESFAFMPKEKLARADEFVLDAEQDLPEFGMDSTWAVWRVDGNKDLKITPDATPADKVWLFGGMRMGGRNYYALDVTDRSKPRLKWVKQGGVDAGFINMGQTWSKPVLGDVKVGGVVKTVLFFAGGYDPKHESAGYTAANVSDARGNQLYIVDPDTGKLLWWASNTGANLNVPAMKYSIPAEPKLFDANKDGLVDAVYVGDLGGQVFRLDINHAASTDSQIGKRMHLLATVGQGVVANTENQRRFFEPPSVATLLGASGTPYVVVAMGAGYRSHPLDTGTNDFFYVFKDMDALRADLASADENSLQATIEPDNLATVDLTVTEGVDMTDAMGWKMDLPEDGEKVLATPIILFGEVFFSSYVPRMGSLTSKCDPVIGISKLWRMSVNDGAIKRDTNGDGVVTVEDRFIDTVVKGLGGAPQLIIGDDGKNAVITGTGAVRNQDFNSPGMRRTRWFTK